MIPWIYHRLTARDQGVDLLRVENQRFTSDGSAATYVWNYTVPQERILLMTNFEYWGQDPIGIPLPVLSLEITQESAADPIWSATFYRDVGSGTQVNVRRTGQPYLICNPGARLQFVSFGGAAGTFVGILSMNGLLVPHGTFSK